MKRLLLVAGLFTFATAFGAFGAQTLPAGCEKETGDILCEDPVGSSEASGGQSQSVDTTDKGDLKNPAKLQCSGPGASSSGC